MRAEFLALRSPHPPALQGYTGSPQHGQVGYSDWAGLGYDLNGGHTGLSTRTTHPSVGMLRTGMQFKPDRDVTYLENWLVHTLVSLPNLPTPSTKKKTAGIYAVLAEQTLHPLVETRPFRCPLPYLPRVQGAGNHSLGLQFTLISVSSCNWGSSCEFS